MPIVGVTRARNHRIRGEQCRGSRGRREASHASPCKDWPALFTKQPRDQRLRTGRAKMEVEYTRSGLTVVLAGHSHWGGPTNEPTKEADDLTRSHCPL